MRAKSPALRGLALALALAALGRAPLARAGDAQPPKPAEPTRPATARDFRPVVTPNGESLPSKVVDGVRVFHLVAEEVRHEFAPGLVGRCWGYNGRVHGPTIEAVEGERIRVYVTNRLPAPTTVHWHGIHLPNGMDGVAGLTQRAIEPGETFRYEWTLTQHGTFMYHPHHDEMVQMALGMMGLLVVHPKAPAGPPPDRDFAILLSEWAMRPGVERPDPYEMTDFNVLTFNGKVFPATAPLVVKKGDRVRIRIGNLSGMDHHPIHIHGTSFLVTETDGGTIPESARWPETTVLVPTGSTRTIEFTANEPGDWAMHCHMTHHTMTQMGHGIPNLIGIDQTAFDQAVIDALTIGRPPRPDGMPDIPMDMPKNSIAMLGGPGPFGYVAMGGMFTVVKVREGITTYDDPGDFVHPAGTVASAATEGDLARDGIDPKVGAPAAATAPAVPATPVPATPAPAPTPTPDHHHGPHGGR